MKKNVLAAVLLLGIAACATNPDGSKINCESETKLEYYNRAMFNFNYHLDKKVVRPVARGYKKITNQFVRNRVTSFFNNLEEPAYFINNVFQGEFKNSGISVSRFLINSTLGLAGTFDVAAGWGLEKKKADFDGTLAKYCVPDGPFFVLPVIGPSTPRYVAGWTADAYASPMYWAFVDSDDNKIGNAIYGAVALKYVNMLAENMDFLDSLEEGSVDYYTAVKSAFLQNRKKFKSLCGNAEENSTPSYDFDFGYDEADEGFEDDTEASGEQ